MLIQHNRIANTKKVNNLKTQINTLNVKQIDELKAEIDALKKAHPPVVMIRRKAAGNGNPVDYFDKNFAEYQEGFSANGEFIL